MVNGFSFHYTTIKVFTYNVCMKSALNVFSITFLAYILPSMIFINGHIINIPNLCAVSLISSINFLMCWTAFITVTRMFSASVSTKACCKNVLKYVSHKKSDRATQAVPCILIPFKNVAYMCDHCNNVSFCPCRFYYFYCTFHRQ